jgi:cell division protein FtsI/penicillin-binding protein 2
MNPITGAVLALAGSAFSETAPPGSTFKIITAAAVLESHAGTLKSTYPYETQALLDGRPVQNAGGETCGGTLVQSFANSCNSVFAPLGVKVGSARLVEMAEKLGFNKPFTNLPNASLSTIPHADQIQGEDATGTTAIGQGQVMASTLQMTDIAATVANKGLRVQPTLQKGTRPQSTRAFSPKVASDLKQMMLAVVRYGTGTNAAIKGASVAGKTGTAEIRDTVPTDPNDPNAPSANDPANTDAWFVAFAPAWAPRVAVGVFLAGAGHGGDTAAPAARDIFLEALKKNR